MVMVIPGVHQFDSSYDGIRYCLNCFHLFLLLTGGGDGSLAESKGWVEKGRLIVAMQALYYVVGGVHKLIVCTIISQRSPFLALYQQHRCQMIKIAYFDVFGSLKLLLRKNECQDLCVEQYLEPQILM